MKLTEEEATKEIRRLKILERYPKSNEGEEALAAALMEVEAARARSFVTDWIQTNRKCPMPCDIYQSVMRPAKLSDFPTVPDASVVSEGYRCNQCEDSGWYIIQLPQLIPGTNEHYTAAKRCYHPAEFKGAKRW